MRTPKYQVWHKEQQRMYMLAGYDHIVDHDYTEPEREYSERIQHVLYTPDLPGCEKVWRADMAEVELREYTGYKDIHGKEIYESDRVRTGQREEGWIVYDHTKAAWIVQSYAYWCFVHQVEEIEAIGNIYETTEKEQPQ